MRIVFLLIQMMLSSACYSYAPKSIVDVKSNDYTELFTRCSGDGCCENSARRLEKSKGYVLKVGEPFICPAGYQPNGLKCPGSYRWCECKTETGCESGSEASENSNSSKPCAAEGMSAGGSRLNSLQCCLGLITTNSWMHAHVKSGCNLPPPPGSSGSCVKCGDRRCDDKNFENKCNCPIDCK